jgi:photosystem II stability/assembly factor-like uncharacterized protein
MGTSNGGLFLSTDNGETWKASDTGLELHHLTICILANGPKLFTGTGGNGLFQSTDNGTTWTSAGLEDMYVNDLAVIGPYLFAGTEYGGVFRSDNEGVSWAQVNTGLTDMCVPALIACPNGTDGMNLFAGTYSGGVFLSSNNGENWKEVNSGLKEKSVRILLAKPNGMAGIDLFAVTYGSGIYWSNNNGSSWTEANTGLTKTQILALIENGPCLFAGIEGGGIFYSMNNGVNWSAANEGLTNMNISALRVSGSFLVAGTSNGEVWRRAWEEMMSAVHSPSIELNRGFYLEQNYPNPLNPFTWIRYSVPETGHIKLIVYDTGGREAAVLVDETESMGDHTVKFDASQLSSGLYIYRLEIMGKVLSRKLMLIK